MKQYLISEDEMLDLVHDATIVAALRAYAYDNYFSVLREATKEIYRDGRTLTEEAEERLSMYEEVCS
mgnify:CR=1 FL=1